MFSLFGYSSALGTPLSIGASLIYYSGSPTHLLFQFSYPSVHVEDQVGQLHSPGAPSLNFGHFTRSLSLFSTLLNLHLVSTEAGYERGSHILLQGKTMRGGGGIFMPVNTRRVDTYIQGKIPLSDLPGRGAHLPS